MGFLKRLFGQSKPNNDGPASADMPGVPQPHGPEVSETSPTTHYDASNFGLMAGLNLLTLPFGFMVLPMLGNDREIEDTIAQDIPIPFGSNMAWLAVKTTTTAKVAAALGLGGGDDPQWRRANAQKSEVRESTWELGLEAAARGIVYVTPPLGEWTLAVSASLFTPAEAGNFIKPLLERLSTEFGEAQFFCTRQADGFYAWARAVNGRLTRGYSERNQPTAASWNEGNMTTQEASLNIRFQGVGETSVNPQDEPADEGVVLQLASYWSIDPSMLSEEFKEPVLGLIGIAPWGQSL